MWFIPFIFATAASIIQNEIKREKQHAHIDEQLNQNRVKLSNDHKKYVDNYVQELNKINLRMCKLDIQFDELKLKLNTFIRTLYLIEDACAWVFDNESPIEANNKLKKWFNQLKLHQGFHKECILNPSILYCAIVRGCLPQVQTLLEQSADLLLIPLSDLIALTDQNNGIGHETLITILLNDYKKNIDLLYQKVFGNLKPTISKEKYEALLQDYGTHLIHEASRRGEKNLVMKLISLGVDLNLMNFEHQTPIVIAIKEKKFHVAQFLKNKNAEIDPEFAHLLKQEIKLNHGRKKWAKFQFIKTINHDHKKVEDCISGYRKLHKNS